MEKSKKTYLIFSGIIQIVILLFYIYSAIFEGMEIAGASKPAAITLFSICSILGLALIIVALLKTKRKKTLITISILMAITGSIETLILSIINIIVLTRKTEEEKKEFKEKKKIEFPKLEEIKSSKAKIIVGIILLTLYFTQIIAFLIDKIVPEENRILAIVLIISSLVAIVVATIYVFFAKLKRDFKAFKENFKTYMKYIKSKFGIYFLIYISISILLTIIIGENSTNQQEIEKLPLWFTIPMVCLYAPFIEEILCRGFIKNAIKNKTVFIIISGLIFGLGHIIGLEHTSLVQYLYVFLYGYMGVFFAYVYQKTDNIFTSITFHFIHNLIGAFFMVLSVFIK